MAQHAYIHPTPVNNEVWSFQWKPPSALDLLMEGAAHLPLPAELSRYLDAGAKTGGIPVSGEIAVIRQFRQLRAEGERSARGAVRAGWAAVAASATAFRVSSVSDTSPGWVPCRCVRAEEAHHLPEKPTTDDPVCLYIGRIPVAVVEGLVAAVRIQAAAGVPSETVAALVETPQLAAMVVRASRWFGCDSPTGSLTWSLLDWTLYFIEGKVSAEEVEVFLAGVSKSGMPVVPALIVGALGVR